jgi:hypothetical protein
MHRARDVEKRNWNGAVGTKNKDRSHVIIVCPTIVEPHLNIRFSALLEVSFRPSIRTRHRAVVDATACMYSRMVSWDGKC